MRITPLSLILFSLLLAGCRKQLQNGNENPPVNTCNCQSPVKPVDTSSVIGCWVLTDTNFYSVPGITDTIWIPVPGDSVIIRFSPDSSFCYGNNFPWSFEDYNKFTEEGNYLYLVDSPNGPNPMSAGIQLVGNNGLILIRHGVDTGVRERYKRL